MYLVISIGVFRVLRMLFSFVRPFVLLILVRPFVRSSFLCVVRYVCSRFVFCLFIPVFLDVYSYFFLS